MHIAGKKALFLDRDGVINVDHGYVYKTSDFEFCDGIFDVCRKAKNLGYLIFVVTNQAGIGRGLYSETEFNILTKWMCSQFIANDCEISKVYFCPTHPVHGIGRFKVESPFRKPNPGMLLQAIHEYGVDPSISLLIGDKKSDVQAGNSAKIGTNLLLSGGAANEWNETENAFVINNLTDAIQYLK